MKIITVSLSRTIPTGPYMNDKVGIEATLEEGEPYQGALDQLNSLITEWHKKANPHLYQESKPQVGGVMFFDNEGMKTGVSIPMSPTPQVIDLKEVRLKESIEDMILECNTLEELSALKQSAGANGLVSQYMKRLNELMVK